jgi:hypothetical protein
VINICSPFFQYALKLVGVAIGVAVSAFIGKYCFICFLFIGKKINNTVGTTGNKRKITNKRKQ